MGLMYETICIQYGVVLTKTNNVTQQVSKICKTIICKCLKRNYQNKPMFCACNPCLDYDWYPYGAATGWCHV